MIYSKRLRLRAAERSDIPRFTAWLNDPEVRQFLVLNTPLSTAEEEQWFERMMARPPVEHVLVIEIKTEEGWRPIGNTSFMEVDWISHGAEVGILIGEKDCWNHGYGRDVMRLMLRHGFNTLNFHRIWLRVIADNSRGMRAYEHAGFVHEGRLRQDVYRDGKYMDLLVMSVLREEWQDSDF